MLDGYSNIQVHIVNGLTIRNEIEIEYTMGGNWMVYDFIPENEIWLDSCLCPDDKLATLWHEIVESSWMLEGLNYNDAHDLASIAERLIRQWIIDENIGVTEQNIKQMFNKYIDLNNN